MEEECSPIRFKEMNSRPEITSIPGDMAISTLITVLFPSLSFPFPLIYLFFSIKEVSEAVAVMELSGPYSIFQFRMIHILNYLLNWYTFLGLMFLGIYC